MWHSLFSCPKNILIMYLIPWNKGKSCHMDGPSLMVQQVFGNPTYRLTFRKRRILDHYLRFCNWSGVSGNGFLGLSKYFISLCAGSFLVHESVRTVNPNLAVALQALYIYIPILLVKVDPFSWQIFVILFQGGVDFFTRWLQFEFPFSELWNLTRAPVLVWKVCTTPLMILDQLSFSLI